MPNHKILQRLLKMLRLGGSGEVHEADTAFSMSITLMEKHNITIETLLDQFQPKDIPQPVMAELARRYCLSRTDLGLSAREEYYRSTFLRIAEWYSQRPKTEAPSKTTEQNTAPNTNQRRSDTGSGATPNQEPQKRDTNTGQGDPTGGNNNRQESNKNTRDRDHFDWKREMDEAREREKESRRREAESEQARRVAEEQARKLQEENDRLRRKRESEENRIRSSRRGFLSNAFSHPLLTIRLFLVCCLYGLPRAVISLVLLAGGLQELGIHTFDSLNWIDALSIALFPFTIQKGIQLYQAGWYP